MYDDYRRIFRDLEAYDQIGRAIDDSYLRQMRDAARTIHDQVAGLDYAARLAAVNFSADLRRAIDPLSGYQNLLDIKAIDRSVAQAVSDTFRPQALAAVEKLLAGVTLPQPALNHEVLMRDLIQVSKFTAAQVAALDDAYEHIRSLQRQVDKSSAALSATFSDALRPLLTAQASWARAAQMPSWPAHFDYLARDVRALFANISELYSTVDRIDSDNLDEEETEQAIALANERLGIAFEETNPLRLVRQIAEFLNQIKVGTLKLAPHARYVLVVILLNVVSNLIYDKMLEPLLNRALRVAKPIIREAKRIRREVQNIPADARVVIASGLIVRRGPSKASAPIGHLYAGDIVSLERTRTRNWSLVVFQSADGDILLRGWVFSRYLARLQGRVSPFDAGAEVSGDVTSPKHF